MLNSFFSLLGNHFLSFLENMSPFDVGYLTLRLCLKNIKFNEYLDIQTLNCESPSKQEFYNHQ